MNPTQQLLQFLEEEGITYGMSKRKIRCTSLAEAMRRKFPEITWVSAKLSGTQLIFEIREGTLPPKEQKEEDSCSLFSEVEGTVEKIVTRRGTPLVKEGDSVERGQELVSGILNITDDSQEVMRYEYVHADADIYIRHKVSYYDTFPLDVEKKVSTGKAKKFFFLQIGSLRLDLSPGEKKKEDQADPGISGQDHGEFQASAAGGNYYGSGVYTEKGNSYRAGGKKTGDPEALYL